MIMKYADLHIHTYYSDSTFSPEEVVSCAKEKGLSAIAICDHDSMEGIASCIEAGKISGVEIIPGVELTVEKLDAEIHLLGYFIDYKSASFNTELKKMRNARVDRIRKMVDKLSREGIEVDAEKVLKSAGRGSVGRLHLAQEILKTGQVSGFKEIFEKYIGFAKPCYFSSLRFTPREAIEAIRSVGGVPVLAHPATIGKDEYIPELVEYGLRGIEIYHTDHKPSMVKRYEGIAKEHGLLVTGGSDCHGMGKGRVLIGTVKVPYEIVDRLKEEADAIRNEKR
jgi:hypothetical protein